MGILISRTIHGTSKIIADWHLGKANHCWPEDETGISIRTAPEEATMQYKTMCKIQ